MSPLDTTDDTLHKILKNSQGTPTLGRYQILGTVGRGNMGEVFRALDPMIGRMVALKTRRFDLVYEEKDLKFVIDKFFEEARIAGNLIHPNIVTIFDVGQDGDYCFIAMELLEGQTLASHNKQDVLLAPERVADLVKRICLALDFAHSRNVIHRDIKPANLMFTKDGRIKITDFGIAMAAKTKTSELQVMGTPSYMSPEQTKGHNLTPQTDFFSLGVVFFELLLGRRPFQGRTLYELMENIRYAPTPSLLTFNSTLPSGLDEVLQKALEKEPDLRYRSGRDFAQDIDRAMKGRPITVHDLKTDKKAQLLRPIDFFKSFNTKEIQEVTRFGTFIKYMKSQVIVREGDVDTTFFVLLSGSVRVIKNNRKITDLDRGACFGEMGALTDTPRSAHVVARKPCIVLKLDLKVLERDSPDLKMKFYQVFIETLISRLEATTRRLTEEIALSRPRKEGDKPSSGDTSIIVPPVSAVVDINPESPPAAENPEALPETKPEN